jgi:hypothetical protein
MMANYDAPPVYIGEYGTEFKRLANEWRIHTHVARKVVAYPDPAGVLVTGFRWKPWSTKAELETFLWTGDNEERDAYVIVRTPTNPTCKKCGGNHDHRGCTRMVRCGWCEFLEDNFGIRQNRRNPHMDKVCQALSSLCRFCSLRGHFEMDEGIGACPGYERFKHCWSAWVEKADDHQVLRYRSQLPNLGFVGDRSRVFEKTNIKDFEDGGYDIDKYYCAIHGKDAWRRVKDWDPWR